MELHIQSSFITGLPYMTIQSKNVLHSSELENLHNEVFPVTPLLSIAFVPRAFLPYL